MKKRHPLRTALLVFAGIVVLVFVGIQLVPVERTNPPVTMEISAPAPVMEILRRSCYDCHSNLTAWPWYSRVAPMSWRVASHVSEGRRHLNFTEWDGYDAEDEADIAEEAYEEAAEGHMPLWDYLMVHRDAALSDADLEALRAWAGVAPGGHGHSEHAEHDGDDDDD